MNRAEHLAWAKTRALEYVDRGELTNAISSLLSDLNKHEHLAHHAWLPLDTFALMRDDNPDTVRTWIEHFH